MACSMYLLQPHQDIQQLAHNTTRYKIVGTQAQRKTIPYWWGGGAGSEGLNLFLLSQPNQTPSKWEVRLVPSSTNSLAKYPLTESSYFIYRSLGELRRTLGASMLRQW